MNNPIRPSAHDEWVTVSVFPAPTKLRNYYGEGEDETHTPCYAFLLQELRSTERSWDEERPGGVFARCGRVTTYDKPYDTRVVAADLSDGELTAAVDVANFVGTDRPDPVPLTPKPTVRLSTVDWEQGMTAL